MTGTAQEHPLYTIWRRPDTTEPHNANSNAQQRCIYTTWLRTGRIATRRPKGPYFIRCREPSDILSAYAYGLSLGASALASRFRDALG